MIIFLLFMAFALFWHFEYQFFPLWRMDRAAQRQQRRETTERYRALKTKLGTIGSQTDAFERTLRGVRYVQGQGVDVTDVIRLLQFDQWLQAQRQVVGAEIKAARTEAEAGNFRLTPREIDAMPSAFVELIDSVHKRATPLREMLGDWVSREPDPDSRNRILERLDAQYNRSRIDDATGRQILLSTERLSIVGVSPTKSRGV